MNSISPSPPFTAEPLDYERDFAQWLAWQTEFLRAKDFEQLDLAHLIEEFAALQPLFAAPRQKQAWHLTRSRNIVRIQSTPCSISTSSPEAI
ncbi:DUF29 family protein [Massilia sp. CF038]|uniref:DUF29 family protein n=1 Tax=Massilia sp. CF038 TaxID=1881045 RepID=UPI00092359E9|nr:DUF29 family protein [Massilia sp. CF038]SHG49002.1 protein of unknown function DUF29 [Massilia sp. CF038]